MTHSPSIGKMRSVPIRGDTLRSLRQHRGWTQADLADQAGYSERLIRKAENGGCLLPATIAVLAQTLSTTNNPVDPTDLWSLPRNIVHSLADFLEAKKIPPAETLRWMTLATTELVVLDRRHTRRTSVGRSVFLEWLTKMVYELSHRNATQIERVVIVDSMQAFLHFRWSYVNDVRPQNFMEFEARLEFGDGKIQRVTTSFFHARC